jgi:hypothetical protein
MPASATQNQWFAKVVEQMLAIEGVEEEILNDGRVALRILYNGASRKVNVVGGVADYRTQKNQFRQVRKTLTELGVKEGEPFVAQTRARRAVTPEMLAAREKQKQSYEAWQELWQTVRKAENSLDAEWELSQMMDYY